MLYEIESTETAMERMAERCDFIARRNQMAAIRIINELFDRTKILGEQPLLGHQLPGTQDPSLREMFFGDYRIIYRVDDKQKRVRILTAQHGRERPRREDELEE